MTPDDDPAAVALPADLAALRALSERLDLVALDGDPSATAVVDPLGCILWVNAAWRAFGAANGARAQAIEPGASYFDAIKGELKRLIIDAAETCMRSGEPFELDYECPSPTERRAFRMRMLSLTGIGLLITHSLRHQSPHVGPAQPPEEARYRVPGGVILMCSNCRRVRHIDGKTWEWVPEWVAHLPDGTSHGLCLTCLEFYWPLT